MFEAHIYLVVVTSKENSFFALAFHRLGAKAEARGYRMLSWAQSFLGWGKQTLHLDIEKLVEDQSSRLKTMLMKNAKHKKNIDHCH